MTPQVTAELVKTRVDWLSAVREMGGRVTVTLPSPTWTESLTRGATRAACTASRPGLSLGPPMG